MLRLQFLLPVLVVLLYGSISTGKAYETDQFSHRQQQINDAQSLLNRKVNLAIGASIQGINDEDDKMKIVSRIYHQLGGISTVDKIEKWAMHSDQIERLDTQSSNSIYSDIPIWATRFGGLAGIGPTIKVNGVLLGTDKLGHFFSQGRKFYIRWLKMQDVEEAAEHSAYTENAIFGKMTTGTYSNADLVANYEGYRFYRSLFEADLLNEKSAILAFKGDHWVMQRPFTWSDYVNDYWDEALNINHYDKGLYPFMKDRLLKLCDWYQSNTDLYEIQDEALLLQRYAFLQFKDMSELRLSNLCTDTNASASQTVSSSKK